MARLLIHLLGPFQVLLGGQPVSGFESDKVRALLAYLAAGTDQPHRRERLAGLFWSEWVERAARANLRRALVNLRKTIGDYCATPPFLNITPQTIQFNRCADAWVDVVALQDLLGGSGLQPGSLVADESIEPHTIRQWEKAVDLYRGEFLQGFSLAGCPEFEQWVLVEQEGFYHLVMDTLYRLSSWYEAQGKPNQALRYAWRQIELDPWWDSGYRQIMHLLAHTGRRAAALEQYEIYRLHLAESLGAEPPVETVRLYERIRDDKLEPPVRMKVQARSSEPTPKLPAFLTCDARSQRYQLPPFVARDPELARLDGFLRRSARGEGRVVFVIGGPGRGKTALLNEFARRAMAEHPDLLVASGNCNAYSGVGDPYLPFREMLSMLTGQVEIHWAAGAISQDHALRLWQALPATVEALLAHGPHVVPALVSGEALLARALAACPDEPWLARLRERIEQRGAHTEGLEQSHLFQQLSNVLHALSQVHPLLLILDDLQWVDRASAGLLFHVGRRLEGARILIACAYRPEEVIWGLEARRMGEGERHQSAPERHPLAKVLAEIRRCHGDVWLDLAEVNGLDGRRFVDALLVTEPNRLGEGFRQTLAEWAGGHPLFTIELLRAMQERGDLARDRAGRWVEGPALNWDLLPARVEGVIRERIERLREDLRQILTVASVEGEDFTAEVVAQVQTIDACTLVQSLSGELQREHRLVRARGLRQVGPRRLALYRFQHHLFQKYLYDHLDQAERVYLHEEVGTELEALYGAQTDEVAVQLARHFLKAGVTAKAAHYLIRAGKQAAARYANEGAIEHFSRALMLLPKTDPATRYGLLLAREQVYHLLGQRDAQGRDLVELETLAQGLSHEQQAEVAKLRSEYARITGYTVVALAAAQMAVERARTAGHVGLRAEAHECWGRALEELGNYDGAWEQYKEAVTLARKAGLRGVEANILNSLGQFCDGQGDRTAAREYYEQALGLYRQAGDQKGEQVVLCGLGDFSHRSGDCVKAWAYYERALGLARQIGFREGELEALCDLGSVHDFLGDYPRAWEYYQQALLIAREIGFRLLEGSTLAYFGDSARRLGDHARAREYAEQAQCIFHEINRLDLESATFEILGFLYRDLGDPVKAQVHYEQALQLNPEGAPPIWSMSSFAGLAWAALAQGDLARAKACAAEILTWLETASDVFQQGNPLRIYLICHQVLRAVGDPRAAEILATAQRLLQEVASRIPDEAMRRSFLENVEENREIVRLAREANLPE